MSIATERMWSELYRPKTVQECILPVQLKKDMQDFVDTGFIPNILLMGPPGSGKTTAARAACEQLGYDVYEINASLKSGIDTLRTDILQHAATISFTGNRKAVLLDEMDYLNPTSTQPALRGFTQEYEENCTFIGTCNYPGKIIKELHSRFEPLDFTIPPDERGALAQQFFARVLDILDKEGVEYDKAAVAGIVKKRFPDFRSTLNALQRYGQGGRIDAGIFVQIDAQFKPLFEAIRSKSFSDVRKWVGENAYIDSTTLFRALYENLSPLLTADSVPQLILHIGEFQYRSAFVADQEINHCAALVSIMSDCNFR